MSAWVHTVVRNEAQLLPYWLRHYGSFCERMVVYDDNSDDGTQDIVRAMGGELRPFPGDGLDDFDMVGLVSVVYPFVRGRADWVIWVDADEFLYHPRMVERLDELHAMGAQCPTIEGFSMVADAPPIGGGQIYDELVMGFPDHNYGKQVLFDPRLKLAFEPGRHDVFLLEEPPAEDGGVDPMRLLHYRYLGREWHELRNARNNARRSKRNLAENLGRTCEPDYVGPYSADWFEAQRDRLKNVLAPA